MGWRIGKNENILSKPYFEDGNGQPNGPSWPKKKFSARNGQTCVTPQALASTKINVLWTRFEQLSHEKLVENFKIGLPEPKLDSGDPKSIISLP
jgi:hypothetical protein